MSQKLETRVALLEQSTKRVVVALEKNTEVLNALLLCVETDKTRRAVMKWVIGILISVGAIVKGQGIFEAHAPNTPDRDPVYLSDRQHSSNKKWREESTPK